METKELFNDFKPISKQAWTDQAIKDLKGDDFNSRLISQAEELEILPFYTKEDVDKIEKNADDGDIANEQEELFEDEDAIHLTWSACEEISFKKETDAKDIFLYAHEHTINWVRISGDVESYLLSLSKSFPLQINISLNPVIDLCEEEIVKKWRDLILNVSHFDLLLWSFELDPVTYWIRSGKIQDAIKSYNNLADIYLRLVPKLPDCKFIKIDAAFFADSGATCVQQLAYALAICNEYFDAMSEREIAIEELMHTIVFRFAVNSDYFLEIAKLRAFKILWTNFIKTWLPGFDFIQPPAIHCETVSFNAPAENKYNTIFRTATEAMSAILGGCDVLSILPYENSENELPKRIARNIHHILRFETHLDLYQNAANESFYVECLTHQMAEKAWELFKDIESNGGFLESWKNGKIKKGNNATGF